MNWRGPDPRTFSWEPSRLQTDVDERSCRRCTSRDRPPFSNTFVVTLPAQRLRSDWGRHRQTLNWIATLQIQSEVRRPSSFVTSRFGEQEVDPIGHVYKATIVLGFSDTGFANFVTAWIWMQSISMVFCFFLVQTVALWREETPITQSYCQSYKLNKRNLYRDRSVSADILPTNSPLLINSEFQHVRGRWKFKEKETTLTLPVMKHKARLRNVRRF